MDLQHVIAFVLLDVAIVIVAARLMGKLFRRIGQPAVIGEIVAGIALGPTLLGAFPGDLDTLLFPTDVRPFLAVIAQLGLALFMFIVGLEVDLSLIRGRERAAGAVAGGAVVLPFALGAGLAIILYPWHAEVDDRPVPMLAFVLFLGVAMSITAMPVLARLLTERGMQRTPTGVLALACAAIDDVIGWILLAVVVAVTAGGSVGGAAAIIGWTVLFVAVMFLVVRPLLARLVAWHARAGLTPDLLAVVLAGLLLSAWITDKIGIHAIFGAFLFGAVMPRKEAAALTRAILERLEQVSLLLLLPVFFVVAGLQVDVGGVGVAGIWQLGLILVAAVVGKFLGAALAARTQGVPVRQQAALGLLMNTRGLTEIVILQVGLQLGVLDPALFTLMVLMALVTTMMTGPLLRRVYPDRVLDRELAAAERAELGGDAAAFTVLAAVPHGPDGRAVAELARTLTGLQRPARVVLCRLPQKAAELEVASGLGAELAMLTGVGDELRVLARELEAAGAQASVIARFSPDPAADLAALAGSAAADVVLIAKERTAPGDTAAAAAADRALAGRTAALVAAPDSAVVVVELADRPATGEGPPVAVVVDGAAGGRAAVRVAALLALPAGRPVAVAPMVEKVARRAGAAAGALSKHGVAATVIDGPAANTAATLVLPQGMPRPPRADGTVMWVRPASADSDEDLSQVVARITVQA